MLKHKVFDAKIRFMRISYEKNCEVDLLINKKKDAQQRKIVEERRRANDIV